MFSYPKQKGFLLHIDELELLPGSINCLVGENGSGKTTLGKIIAGLLKPKEGTISLDGKKISGQSPSKLSKTIGYTFQNPDSQLFSPTVDEEILLAIEPGTDFLNNNSRVEEWLSRFGIMEYRNKHPKRLSRGEKQKVVLCSILINNPSVLILDEPFSGIDLKQTFLLMEFLQSLKLRGKIIIIITHKLDVVVEFSDSIIGLKNGRIAVNNTVDTFPSGLLDIKEELGLKLPLGAMLLLSLHEKGIIQNIRRLSELEQWYDKRKKGK